jgi:rSAM/selenodomain-associated transferase 2
MDQTERFSLISIIIPVLNESNSINSLISHIRSLDSRKKPEIIVVDGDRDAETLEVISADEVIKIKSLPGRGKQMNKGAKAAKGDIVLFLHSDTELPPDGLMLIESAMDNEKYVGGAFDLHIKSTKSVFRLIECVASIRSRITRIPFGDQAIFMRKESFDRIGGFQEILLMEDIELMQKIKKHGDKIFIIKERVLTSSRRWDREGILRCTFRNWFLQILFFAGVSPRKLAKFYPQG